MDQGSEWLKSRLMAAYIDAASHVGEEPIWNVRQDYDNLRCEDVVRWMKDRAPKAWSVWCRRFNVQIDQERNEFVSW